MRLVPIALFLAGFVACDFGGSAECGPAECAAFCADATEAPGEATEEAAEAAAPSPSSAASLTTFESDVVGPILADIREGVRPFDEEGIGICKGKRECDEYLGREVGELPPGDYILKAELRVPRTGDAYNWTVDVATECETVRKTESGETRSTSNNSRSYDVRYAGEDRGYRLMPLRTIESPSTGGSRTCKWTITAPHPDGDKVYSGSWSTPDKG